MKKICLLLSVLYFVIPNKAKAFYANPSDSLEMAIDFILAKHTGSDKPGLTIGIVKDGNLIFKKGYGMANLKTHRPNNKRVVYNLASGSKQFTAFAVATLINQKKLTLTDNIGMFLPEFPAYGKNITIANLLYHTSGIRDYMALMWLTGRSFESTFSSKNALDIIFRQSKLNFTPGARCIYSNSNYILLAEIIHRITRQTLAEYTHNALKKLGMNNTDFFPSYTDGKTVRAISYSKSGGTYQAFESNFTAYGDGGMLTTIEDLAIWDREFYDENSLVQHILKRGTLNNGNILNYGMGIIFDTYRNEATQTHTGAFLGFRTETLRFPSKRVSIICLGNYEEINPESITKAIADVYLFGDKNSSTNKNGIEAYSLKSSKMTEPIIGTYQVVPNVLIQIRHEDDLIIGQVTGQPRQVLYAESNNTYKIGTTNDEVVFQNLLNGKYQELIVMQKSNTTSALRLKILSPEYHSRYTGYYYSAEQNATYHFYSKDGDLWFKTGDNAAVKAEVLLSYNQIYFDYRNLEHANIKFLLDANDNINGFILNSGRVSDLYFTRK